MAVGKSSGCSAVTAIPAALFGVVSVRFIPVVESLIRNIRNVIYALAITNNFCIKNFAVGILLVEIQTIASIIPTLRRVVVVEGLARSVANPLNISHMATRPVGMFGTVASVPSTLERVVRVWSTITSKFITIAITNAFRLYNATIGEAVHGF